MSLMVLEGYGWSYANTRCVNNGKTKELWLVVVSV